MSLTDPIADFLIMMKNASIARKENVDCPSSNIREQIAKLLKQNDFILNYKKVEDKKQGFLRVYLKYKPGREKKPAITSLKRISKPGLRKYVKADKIPKVLGGIGIAIISTSKGIMTDEQCREASIGGEALCYVW